MLTLLLLLQLNILHPKPLYHDGLRETAHSWIVVHSTESCSTVKSVIDYLRKTKKSYHFIIDRNGIVSQLVDPQWMGSHAGLSFYGGVWHWNRFGIGISFMQCKDQIYTEAQYKSGKLLVQMLARRYPDITKDRIIAHSTIAFWRGRKHDPGKNFDMSRILPLDKP